MKTFEILIVVVAIILLLAGGCAMSGAENTIEKEEVVQLAAEVTVASFVVWFLFLSWL